MERPYFAPDRVGLQTDFYLLVLAAVYHADGLWGEATFDLYARELPEGCGYLVAGGVVEAVEQALQLGFTAPEIAWMRGLDTFAKAPEAWWSALEHMRFDGEIHAVAEGTVVFPGEPVLRVTAPLVQATLLESRLVQTVGYGTAVATRASRIIEAAGDRKVFDFGSRRMPSGDAALLAARAAMVGGFAGTTNSLAAAVLGVPVMGTLSAGFSAAYGDDARALEAFRVHFPDVGYVSLPQKDVVEAVLELVPHRASIRIVRLDRRDLGRVSRRLRGALDAAGMERVKILGSGGLDEPRIAALEAEGAPVDLLAVGRNLSQEPPKSGMVYRLAEIWRGPDPEPATHTGASRWPGMKQVVRFHDHDLVCLVEELEDATAGGRPLLEPVVLEGERVRPAPTLETSQARRAAAVAALPEGVRALNPTEAWPVRVSDRLAALSLG
ncbi:MAG: hypothetical protein H6739_22455 [Alphaproteobacteria bacterium]|nr:hypothetical protein [Alphaproteobacteria bacterium]